MNKLLILISMLVILGGCSYPKVVKVPRPMYPNMKQAVIKDKVIQGDNVQDVIDNMLGMSKLIDQLYLCPCWAEEE